ncbi:hypothetical protein PTKIN_Ptkin08bG0133700 [Pterospermum kingtungense]
MMSPDNPPVKPATTKEENQNGGNRKTASRPQDQQDLKCPRCDSPNTKFCYYNNYSLTQPRHFCKTCRRYWTKGGALRNVPIGGGCRKNKKIKTFSRLSGDSKDSTSSAEMGGLKFFHGLSPAMDFQLGGLSFPRLNPSAPGTVYSQFASFGDSTSPSFSLDPSGSSSSLMGFSNYPLSSVTSGLSGAIQEMGSLNVNSSLASSIESLSSINQDLHWKLQQQRLAMLYGEENQKENTTTVSSVPLENQAQKPQPILFQNLEAPSKPEISAVGNPRKGTSCNETATEWFFGNSYAPVTPTPTTSSNGNDNTNNWNGVQAWNDLHQYSTLP